VKECPECRKLFLGRPAQVYCSRRCARTAQARQGVPSIEDKKAQFADAILAKFDEIFRLK
jgi:hypothetical protein